MAVDRNAFKSRRSVLAAALGGLGALLAGALGRADEAEAAQGGNALIGVANTGTAETSFENTDGGEVSLKGKMGSVLVHRLKGPLDMPRAARSCTSPSGARAATT